MLFSDFLDMCNQVDAQITSLTNQVNDLTNQLTVANNSNTTLQQQITTLQGQLDTLNQNVATLTAANNTLTANNTDLANQIQTAQAQIVTLQQQIAALQQQIVQLQAAASNTTVNAALMDVVTGRRALTVLSNLQMLPADTTTNKEQPGVWIDSGGHTAQTSPGTNTTPHGTFTWTPGTATTPARIDFQPAAAWDNIFEYERFTLPSNLPTYVVDIRSFAMTAADRAAANCVEFQQEFTWSGKTYNMGWQWNFGAKLFRYFNFNTKVWQPSTVPFVDLGATPVILMAEYILDQVNGTTTHLAFSVNGVRTPLNITQSATPKVGAANKYTISINQLDSDSKGDPFGVYIYNCEARYIV